MRLSLRPAPPARLAPAAAGQDVQVFQSATAKLIDGPEPVQTRLALILLAGMFALLLVIAASMRIDRVISSSSGKIITVEPTVVLGALDQSIIRTIDVGEGQEVHKGELLATLDPTFTKADVGALKSQLASLDAQIARCQAELAQKPFIMPPTSDPVANGYIAAQRDYYLQRKAQFDAQLHSYNDQIAQYQATIVKYRNDAALYGERAKVSNELEQMRATLAATQFGSKLDLLTATDHKLEIERSLEFDKNAIAETQHQLDSTKATRDAFVQQWFAAVSQELVKAQGDRDTAAQSLTKAAKHDDLVRIEAPQDAMVLKIAKLSPLSVLKSSDPLFYLAPLDSPLEAEIHIAPRDIAFIQVGDATTIKLDAYNFIDHGTVAGTVKAISDGTFTTTDTGAATDPYYKVFVTLQRIALQNVPPGFRLVPGITLSGDIHIGSRSLFTYLMGGIMRGFDEAMREP